MTIKYEPPYSAEIRAKHCEPDDEQEELLKDRSPEFIVGLALHLAKIIRQIGDEFDLIGK